MTALIIATSGAAEAASQNPPARFDHPYTGELVVRSLSPRKVAEMCVDRRALGCAHAWRDGTKCIVYVIDRKTKGVWPSEVLNHEIGHCNGWDGLHEE